MSNSEITYKKILVPLDGSDFSERALPHAQAIARRMGASLILVRVVKPLSSLLSVGELPDEEVKTWERRAMEHAEEYLRAWVTKLQEDGFPTKGIVEEASCIAEAVLEAAAEEGADLIVMTTHGRGGVARWVYGSVALKILQGATVPVLLIRSLSE